MCVGNNVKEMKLLHTISRTEKCKEKDVSVTHHFYTIKIYIQPSHSTLAFHQEKQKRVAIRRQVHGYL